jgi:hypothetical protein
MIHPIQTSISNVCRQGLVYCSGINIHTKSPRHFQITDVFLKFVCRKPDENHEGVYRFLLKRNRRLYGVAYTLDNVGDIYLVGRMSLASVDAAELDRVLGQVLEAVDTDFNTLLELGFRSSIQKEWDWRVSRGESLKNLQAFAHLIDDD